jgi:hypothetical protein
MTIDEKTDEKTDGKTDERHMKNSELGPEIEAISTL